MFFLKMNKPTHTHCAYLIFHNLWQNTFGVFWDLNVFLVGMGKMLFLLK